MTYKHSNGHLVQRDGSGRFRKTTLKDMGIDNANTQGIVFICNVCEREFIPILMSGTCCGVDNKRPKPVIVTPAEQEIMDKISALKGRPFINRQILNEINELEVQLSRVRQNQRK